MAQKHGKTVKVKRPIIAKLNDHITRNDARARRRSFGIYLRYHQSIFDGNFMLLGEHRGDLLDSHAQLLLSLHDRVGQRDSLWIDGDLAISGKGNIKLFIYFLAQKNRISVDDVARLLAGDGK